MFVKWLTYFGGSACLNVSISDLQRRLFGLRPFNVCFYWLDATTADSRPASLFKAECQGVMRDLVVKFRI